MVRRRPRRQAHQDTRLTRRHRGRRHGGGGHRPDAVGRLAPIKGPASSQVRPTPTDTDSSTASWWAPPICSRTSTSTASRSPAETSSTSPSCTCSERSTRSRELSAVTGVRPASSRSSATTRSPPVPAAAVRKSPMHAMRGLPPRRQRRGTAKRTTCEPALLTAPTGADRSTRCVRRSSVDHRTGSSIGRLASATSSTLPVSAPKPTSARRAISPTFSRASTRTQWPRSRIPAAHEVVASPASSWIALTSLAPRAASGDHSGRPQLPATAHRALDQTAVRRRHGRVRAGRRSPVIASTKWARATRERILPIGRSHAFAAWA